MAKILVACASLRSGSVNAATMRAALANLPEGVEAVQIDIADLPLYNADVEEAGLPESVVALNEAMQACDGLVIFTPEYNGSYPAVAKNVIDWLSRPPKMWEGRGLTLVVTTPGPRAGQSLRGHFDTVTAFFPVKHHPAHGIGSYGEILEDGEVTDEATIAGLREFIADFGETCTRPAQ